MATNPNNAIGTNAAYGGRTSPKAFNDVLASFKGRGIISGWEISPNSGMTVSLGGDGEHRDVAYAEDSAGNMTSVDNISESPINLTIAAAPATQSRIDAIVVYVNNPPQGTSTATDNYGAVGILDVQGATASTPLKPDDAAIRTAITADGASGATAYYVVLGYITIANGTTTITSSIIEQGEMAELNEALVGIPDNSITASKLSWASVIDKIYPVGSIYMSTNNVSPATFIGGTWQVIKDTFLLSAGDTYTAGNTGGEATHKLTVQEMPSHSHNFREYYNTYWDNVTQDRHAVAYNNNTSGSSSAYTNNTGGNQAHNNMPPYLVVYVWKRTA